MESFQNVFTLHNGRLVLCCNRKESFIGDRRAGRGNPCTQSALNFTFLQRQTSTYKLETCFKTGKLLAAPPPQKNQKINKSVQGLPERSCVYKIFNPAVYQISFLKTY